MTSPLQTRLADLLAKAVDRHHLVVWQDDRCAYDDVARAVVPDDVTFARFDGSWFELRNEIEVLLAGHEPPRLVVYVGSPAPKHDPLAELRAAGHEFEVPLRQLITDAFADQLPASQLAAIAETATDFATAAASGTGVNPGQMSLVPALGSGLSEVDMVVAIVGGARDAQLDHDGLWPDVHRLIERSLAVTTTATHHELRATVARVLLLDAIDRAGALPDRLTTALPSGSDDQRSVRARVLDEWWLRAAQSAGEAFRHADQELRLENLDWTDGLADIDVAPSLETATARQVLDLVAHGDGSAAEALARKRGGGRWARLATLAAALDDGWSNRWRALVELSALTVELGAAPPPKRVTGAEVLRWYADAGWRVDRAHRRLELALTSVAEQGELETPVAQARSAYEGWLDAVIESFLDGVERHGYDTGDLVLQSSVFDRFVAKQDGLTAYIWVDAFRYELASDVAESLRAGGADVELLAGVAAAPTITLVGMANLCPGADASFSIDEADGSLVVGIDGTTVRSVEDRRRLLRGALGEVIDLELGKCVQLGEQALRTEIEGTSAVLVRSTEFDVHGEAGLLSAAWSGFAETQATLPRVVAKLAKAGVRRVVISADHGFIALSRRLGGAYKVEAPRGGSGELHRRAWIGRGGVDQQSTVRVPLAATGVTSELDLLVPRGLALFKAGGSKQFFHGGLSPQELVIPVIIADIEDSAETAGLKVGVDVVGEQISTAVFAATVSFEGDLFTDSVVVRAIARRGSDLVVAHVVNGDGFDSSSGTIEVPVTNEARLMFQVTKRLDPEDRVEVQVLDARTDAVLGKATVTVATTVTTFDDDLED